MVSLGYFSKLKNQQLNDITLSEEFVMFRLMFKKTTIGYLVFENKEWLYYYSNEFKMQNDIQPIIGFPNSNKIYRSCKLFPFFAFRIPSLKRPEIQEIIRNNNIDKCDIVSLLKFFGKRTIANPFLLEII